MINTRFVVLLGMVLAAAASRLFPHPPNLTPIGAIAIFGGAYFSHRAAAFLVPLAAMFLSDLVIGLHSGMPVVYACFVATTCIGLLLRKRRTAGPIAAATLASTLLFYFATNFAVWLGGHGRLYPQTLSGLALCYTAALPFLRNMLLGNFVYVGALCGGFALAERCFASLREPATASF